MGEGRFVAPKTLEVSLNDGGTRTLAGAQVFLNLGTHAPFPNIPGLEAAKPLTHIEALELDVLPAHLIVIGGGYAGLELAQAYRRFGSRSDRSSRPGLSSWRGRMPTSRMKSGGFSADEGIQIHRSRPSFLR